MPYLGEFGAPSNLMRTEVLDLNFKKHFAHECNAHINCGNLNRHT